MNNKKRIVVFLLATIMIVLNSSCSRLNISISSNKVSGTLKTNALAHISQEAARKAFKKVKDQLSKSVKVDLSKATLRGFLSEQELILYELDTTKNQGQTCLVITPLYAKIQDYLIAIISENVKGKSELAPVIIKGIAQYISKELQRRIGLQQWICINKKITPNAWTPIEDKLRILTYYLDKDMKFIQIRTDADRIEELMVELVGRLVRGEVKISIKPTK